MELYRECAMIVQHDPRLRKQLEVREYKSRIAHSETGSRYIAVAADGNALHGDPAPGAERRAARLGRKQGTVAV